MPRYLILLTVPADQNRLAELHDDGLLLRHCAYFTSIADKPRIADASTTSSRASS